MAPSPQILAESPPLISPSRPNIFAKTPSKPSDSSRRSSGGDESLIDFLLKNARIRTVIGLTVGFIVFIALFAAAIVLYRVYCMPQWELFTDAKSDERKRRERKRQRKRDKEEERKIKLQQQRKHSSPKQSTDRRVGLVDGRGDAPGADAAAAPSASEQGPHHDDSRHGGCPLMAGRSGGTDVVLAAAVGGRGVTSCDDALAAAAMSAAAHGRGSKSSSGCHEAEAREVLGSAAVEFTDGRNNTRVVHADADDEEDDDPVTENDACVTLGDVAVVLDDESPPLPELLVEVGETDANADEDGNGDGAASGSGNNATGTAAYLSPQRAGRSCDTAAAATAVAAASGDGTAASLHGSHAKLPNHSTMVRSHSNSMWSFAGSGTPPLSSRNSRLNIHQQQQQQQQSSGMGHYLDGNLDAMETNSLSNGDHPQRVVSTDNGNENGNGSNVASPMPVALRSATDSGHRQAVPFPSPPSSSSSSLSSSNSSSSANSLFDSSNLFPRSLASSHRNDSINRHHLRRRHHHGRDDDHDDDDYNDDERLRPEHRTATSSFFHLSAIDDDYVGGGGDGVAATRASRPAAAVTNLWQATFRQLVGSTRHSRHNMSAIHALLSVPVSLALEDPLVNEELEADAFRWAGAIMRRELLSDYLPTLFDLPPIAFASGHPGEDAHGYGGDGDGEEMTVAETTGNESYRPVAGVTGAGDVGTTRRLYHSHGSVFDEDDDGGDDEGEDSMDVAVDSTTIASTYLSRTGPHHSRAAAAATTETETAAAAVGDANLLTLPNFHYDPEDSDAGPSVAADHRDDSRGRRRWKKSPLLRPMPSRSASLHSLPRRVAPPLQRFHCSQPCPPLIAAVSRARSQPTTPRGGSRLASVARAVLFAGSPAPRQQQPQQSPISVVTTSGIGAGGRPTLAATPQGGGGYHGAVALPPDAPLRNGWRATTRLVS